MQLIEVVALAACFLFGLGCFAMEWLIKVKRWRRWDC